MATKEKVILVYKEKPYSITYRCNQCQTHVEFQALYCQGCGDKFTQIVEVVKPS